MAETRWFRRLLLPGLAFKAVVIGGGYATGRELATFFIPAGAIGGLYGIALSTVIWSMICAITFLFARRTGSLDYRSFFQHLLGPFWPIYEIAYLLALIVILAVFAAAAGAIGSALFGAPQLVGALALMTLIAVVASYGNESVERLFKYVSFVLYGTYAAFIGLSFGRFGDRITAAFGSGAAEPGWFAGGVTYAGYNIIGAIVILPVVRHMKSDRDAVVAGLLAGPLAMLPALLFFICMVAFIPEIGNEMLPSDFLLEKLRLPGFRVLFQLMIFLALLESGTGGVHAINERIAHSYRARRAQDMPTLLRLSVTWVILILSVFVAGEFGLVQLIASGYRWLAYAFLLIYVLPMLTIGSRKLLARLPIVLQ